MTVFPELDKYDATGLAELVKKHQVKPEELVDILEKANFKRTSIKQLSGNIVCIYKSRKI